MRRGIGSHQGRNKDETRIRLALGTLAGVLMYGVAWADDCLSPHDGAQWVKDYDHPGLHHDQAVFYSMFYTRRAIATGKSCIFSDLHTAEEMSAQYALL